MSVGHHLCTKRMLRSIHPSLVPPDTPYNVGRAPPDTFADWYDRQTRAVLCGALRCSTRPSRSTPTRPTGAASRRRPARSRASPRSMPWSGPRASPLPDDADVVVDAFDRQTRSLVRSLRAHGFAVQPRRFVAARSVRCKLAVLTPPCRVGGGGGGSLRTLDGIVEYLDDGVGSALISVYLIDNVAFSALEQGADRSAKVERFVRSLDTISIQRSFIADDIVAAFCWSWSAGQFALLTNLNLSQNLVSDFEPLARCLCSLDRAGGPLNLWLADQLRPANHVSDAAMLKALESNARIISLEYQWRKREHADRANAILSQRTVICDHKAELQAAMLSLQSNSPNLRVFRMRPDVCRRVSVDSIRPAMDLLASNVHLGTLELPGNDLTTNSFVNCFVKSVNDGHFRSLRFVNLENNRFVLHDIRVITGLLLLHFTVDEHLNGVLPLESLRLEHQTDLQGTNLIETDQDIMSRLTWNVSLLDLTADIGLQCRKEVDILMQRNLSRASLSKSSISDSPKRKSINSSRSSIFDPIDSPKSTTSTMSKQTRARFLFSPTSPVESPVFSLTNVDEVMSLIVRQSPHMKDFSVIQSGFLQCLPELGRQKYSRIIVSLLAPNLSLRTIRMQDCAIEDWFVDALVAAGEQGHFQELRCIDFTRNRLSDESILALLESPFFELEELRVRHRKVKCARYHSILILAALQKKHRIALHTFDFEEFEYHNEVQAILAARNPQFGSDN